MTAFSISPATEEEVRSGDIGRRLRQFNYGFTGEYPEMQPVRLNARDPGGQVVGGLRAYVFLYWLRIDVLFVDEAVRGQGVGTALLAEGERLARDHGARHVLLDTFEWQAPRFYARHGYEEVARIPDYAAGFYLATMRKDLVAPAAVTPGFELAPSVDAAIRRLGAADAEAFAGLRREVTADNPVPMGLTLAEEQTRTLEGFREQLDAVPNAVFGLFAGDELVGTAAVSWTGRFPSSAHKVLMWGVFVSPRHRRQGYGRRVVAHALRHAFGQGARRVHLMVYVPNAPALAMYRGLGFGHDGIEPEAVCLAGRYHDGVHMSLLNPAKAALA